MFAIRGEHAVEAEHLTVFEVEESQRRIKSLDA